MKTPIKRIALLLLVSTIWSMGTSSCRNTVRGVGRDVERVGDRIENAATR